MSGAKASPRVLTARLGDTTPAPARRRSYGSSFLGVAEPMMAALISRGVQPGCASLTRAATPAVAGEDIDVPERPLPWSTVEPSAEKTPTPGAATSGLTRLSNRRGPPEVNGATFL